MEPSSPSHNRAVVLMFFLFLWAALVAARLFYFTVYARDEYLAAVERVSKRVGRIPATRGRIISSDGEVLAWTEIRTDLRLITIPASEKRRRRLENRLAEDVPGFSFDSAVNDMTLKRNLSPEEVVKLFPFVSGTPEIEFVAKTSRRRKKGVPETLIGSTRLENGRVIGVSGYEKKYDERLRGRDGEFQVMVDRMGRWIPGTWKELTAPRNGEDVVVSL